MACRNARHYYQLGRLGPPAHGNGGWTHIAAWIMIELDHGVEPGFWQLHTPQVSKPCKVGCLECRLQGSNDPENRQFLFLRTAVSMAESFQDVP